MALDGSFHSSRARFSDTIATGRVSDTSAHVKSRPATRRLPMVAGSPGDAILNRRSGAMRPSA